MAAIELNLSPKIIEWIANKQGVSKQHLAGCLNPKKQEKFLEGKVNKTIAVKLAKLAGIPFGYLFLEHPLIEDKLEVPDFRRCSEHIELSKNFTDTYKDILFKIDWYKDYLTDIGADKPIPFVGKYTIRNSIDEISEDITKTIKFNLQKELKKLTFDSYFRVISKLVENAGILVFKNGVVGNNTTRKLNIKEFRGFSIIDNISPAVFINEADSFSAQVFTLFHEIAHIWIGKGGISNWDFENKIEAFCNKIAANILMPNHLYLRQWNTEAKNIDDVFHVNKYVAKYFKVSEYACSIKAKELHLISKGIFAEIKNNCINNQYLHKKKNSGGNQYNVIPYRNSNKITDAILSLAMSQKLPLREAARILNIKNADTIIELYKKRTSK